MHTLKEIAESLKKLKSGKIIRFNIHYIIPEPLCSFCLYINNTLAKLNRSFFSIAPNSIYMSRLTLLTGSVNSHEMLEKTLQVVASFAEKTKPFKLDPTVLYFKESKDISSTMEQYLFLDTLQNDFLQNQKLLLENMLKDIVISFECDIKIRSPQINLGCCRKVTYKIDEAKEKFPLAPSCTIRQLGLSFAGKKDVSISYFKFFDLSE